MACLLLSRCSGTDAPAELDALGEDFYEDDLAIPSYLSSNTEALPDFVDEAPVAEHTIVRPLRPLRLLSADPPDGAKCKNERGRGLSEQDLVVL